MIALTIFALRMALMSKLMRVVVFVLPKSEHQHFANAICPYLAAATARLAARQEAWRQEVRRSLP